MGTGAGRNVMKVLLSAFVLVYTADAALAQVTEPVRGTDDSWRSGIRAQSLKESVVLGQIESVAGQPYHNSTAARDVARLERLGVGFDSRGGNNQFIGTIEYRYSAVPTRSFRVFGANLYAGVPLAGFVDVGSACGHSNDFSDGLIVGAGIGLRVYAVREHAPARSVGRQRRARRIRDR